MRKVYRKLTEEQKDRGVIFSSQLKGGIGVDNSILHEVLATDENKNEVMDRLLEDKFFNASPWKYNEIRK